jgi:hypothetical protein
VVWPRPQNHSDGFPGLGLKTGLSGLVICALKLPRRFLGLGLKIKQASVCQLRHKINGVRTAWDTHQDLVAYFTWKQVTLEFPSLSLRLTESRRRAVHVAPLRRLCRDKVKVGRVNAMGCVRPGHPYFVVFYVLGSSGIVVFESFVWSYK